MRVLVLVAPGQGAQKSGFLTPWLELPGVADRLRWWSAVTGLDLVHYGTEADEEDIRDTAVAQPLLVAAGLVAAEALFAEFAEPGDQDVAEAVRRAGVAAVAGHSVGELTAAVTAGVLSAESAMVLVRRRGLAMAEAAAATPTGMSACLGGDPDTVVAHLAKLGLTPANLNGAGQIVAAGTEEQLAALAADPPEKARVRPLKVAGAFHTDHMAPAVSELAALVRGMPVGQPRVRCLSNRDGQAVDSGERFARRLVEQVSHPVRWDACMESFQDSGVTALIELCPGGTLTGLAKRALPGVATVALKKPDDLASARTLISEHAGTAPAARD